MKSFSHYIGFIPQLEEALSDREKMRASNWIDFFSPKQQALIKNATMNKSWILGDKPSVTYGYKHGSTPNEQKAYIKTFETKLLKLVKKYQSYITIGKGGIDIQGQKYERLLWPIKFRTVIAGDKEKIPLDAFVKEYENLVNKFLPVDNDGHHLEAYAHTGGAEFATFVILVLKKSNSFYGK